LKKLTIFVKKAFTYHRYSVTLRSLIV